MVVHRDHPGFSLFQFLACPDIHPSEVVGALEEFAFRSLLRNKRVREWCKDVTDVLEHVGYLSVIRLIVNSRVIATVDRSIHAQIHSSEIRRCMATPPLHTLFPFVDVPSNPYFPVTTPPAPPPLLALSSLQDISRKQLIDVLTRFSREISLVREEDGVLNEALIVEVCLEYVGRRWRERGDKGYAGFQEIAKKLSDIEFDVSTCELGSCF